MNRFTRLTPAEHILCGVAIAICLYYLTTFLFLVLSNFWPGPLFDYWVDIPLIEKYFNQQLNFHDLVNAHNNAHRILIPRLLFILDYRFFAGTNILLITVSILCKFFTLLLFNILLKNQTLQTRLCLNALICSAILNAGNVYNILFNFDIQWDLVSVFACYAIFFYTSVFNSGKQTLFRTLAWIFMGLGFFCHAGALSIPVTFAFISALHRKPGETVLNILLVLGMLCVHSLLPFSDPDNSETQNAFAVLLLHPVAVGTFVTKFISGSLAFYLGTPGLYFSVYILMLIGVSVARININRESSSHVFGYISLFLFFMIVSIAASRTVFSPRIWAASRFQTTALLFIVCLHIHVWLTLPDFLKERMAVVARSIIALHGFSLFFLLQYFTYNIPYKLSNTVFSSQAYMLSHERNQNDGSHLLLWLHDDHDVIADSDAFFRKNGFAWYTNKQLDIQSRRDFVDTGKALLSTESIVAFENDCEGRIHTMQYQPTPDEGISFSAALPQSFLTPQLFHRNTYYALDKNGISVGSAYISVNEDGALKRTSLAGYSVAQTVRFIAGIDNHHQPRCLYSVDE